MNVAVIDLGTNTFNLLIAKITTLGFDYKFHKKIPVKLGEGGINNKTITEAAFQRGINAIAQYHQIVSYYGCEKTLAFATSAMRNAQNGNAFIQQVLEQFGIEIKIITGEREAELIYFGVRQTVNMGEEPSLILDIGGGSNEFIIANQQQVFWKHSFPLGIARLLDKFNPSDPITISEISQVRQYLGQALKPLFTVLKQYPVKQLIGASGSFETFTAMLQEEDRESEVNASPEPYYIDTDTFKHLHNKLVNSTLAERKNMKGLELMRVEMIVLAAVFVKFVLDNTGINTLCQSNYALKEGIIYELINPH